MHVFSVVSETRAWDIKVGATAPQAAGAIHTDFERGFIRAEVVSYEVSREVCARSLPRFANILFGTVTIVCPREITL